MVDFTHFFAFESLLCLEGTIFFIIDILLSSHRSDMEDALEDKVATQLRENGVAETRVPVLSAKIAQAVRDDVIDASQGTSPQVTRQNYQTLSSLYRN